MPSDALLKTMNTLHRLALKVSGGFFGRELYGMRSVELTTTGRKSGNRHSVLLTAPIVDGEMVVVVASRGGDVSHPAWYLNLEANSDVELAFTGGPRRPMTARTATPDERAVLWPRVVEIRGAYGAYQRRTSREIPLVLLTPRTPIR